MSDPLNDFDAFLEDAPQRRDFKAGKWRKDGSGSRIVFLHKRVIPIRVNLHTFPKRIEMKEKPEDKEKIVKFFGVPHVCHESNEHLARRRLEGYERGSNRFKVAAESCPFDLLSDWLLAALETRQISWTDVLFDFNDATYPKDNVVIHVGGYLNLFGRRDLTDGERTSLRQAGIALTEAWKENASPKENYVVCYVDEANPDAGLIVSTEPGILIQKMRTAIQKAQKDRGREDGLPWLNPYAIEWEFDNKKPNFQDKYDASTRLSKTPNAAILRMIDGPVPPAVHAECRPFDAFTLRETMETYANPRIGIPFDQIFANARPGETFEEQDAAEAAYEEERRAARDRALERKRLAADSEASEPAPATSAPASPPVAFGGGRRPVDTAPPVEETEPCYKCQKQISVTAEVCPHCGQRYALVDGVAPAPAPAAPAAKPKQAAPPAPAAVESVGEDGSPDPDDEIPF